MVVASNSTLYIVYYNSTYNTPSPDTSHQKVLQTTKGRSESSQSRSRVVGKSLKKYTSTIKVQKRNTKRRQESKKACTKENGVSLLSI